MGFGSNLPSMKTPRSQAFAIDLMGERELMRALTDLPSKVNRKTVRIALNAGGGVIKPLAMAGANMFKRTGLLAKSIIVKQPKAKHVGSFLCVIGPKSQRRMVRKTKRGTYRFVGKKSERQYKFKAFKKAATATQYINPGKYGHLLEYGHAGPGGSGRRTPAHPFMRPSWEMGKWRTRVTIIEVLWNGIRKHAQSLGAKGGARA